MPAIIDHANRTITFATEAERIAYSDRVRWIASHPLDYNVGIRTWAQTWDAYVSATIEGRAEEATALMAELTSGGIS